MKLFVVIRSHETTWKRADREEIVELAHIYISVYRNCLWKIYLGINPEVNLKEEAQRGLE
jgi:hypothetical protein